MDAGTRLLFIVLALTVLIIVDVAWYRSYHLSQIARLLEWGLSGRW